MITRLSIAFEDFLGSSIVPQVLPPWKEAAIFIENFCTVNPEKSEFETYLSIIFWGVSTTIVYLYPDMREIYLFVIV